VTYEKSGSESGSQSESDFGLVVDPDCDSDPTFQESVSLFSEQVGE